MVCSCTLIGIGIASVVLFLLRRYFRGGQFTENVSARGKVAVVTGANTGIGLETVKDLNQRGAKVFMICRSEQRAADAKKELVKDGCDASRLIVVTCDLGSKDSVRQCAAKMSKFESHIDILINNAGVWMSDDFEKTKDGHEMTWHCNHLGHVQLTELLLPLVEKAPAGRVVIVSSLVHEKIPALDLSTVDTKEGYGSAADAYNRSKLANVMHARELTRRLRAKGNTVVTANSLHPGVIPTELLRKFNPLVKVALLLFRFFQKTRKDGAQTTLYVALSSDLKGVSGQYFADCAQKKENPVALNDLACKQLYDYSLKTVGLA